MRKVGMGAEKEEMEVQTVPYEEYMDAVREIEQLQGLLAGLKAENETLKAAEKSEKDKK